MWFQRRAPLPPDGGLEDGPEMAGKGEMMAQCLHCKCELDPEWPGIVCRKPKCRAWLGLSELKYGKCPGCQVYGLFYASLIEGRIPVCGLCGAKAKEVGMGKKENGGVKKDSEQH